MVEFEAPCQVEVARIHPVSMHPQHHTRDSGDRPELWSPFKTQFLRKFELIVDARLEKKKSLSLQPKFVGLPLFGGVNRKTESC